MTPCNALKAFYDITQIELINTDPCEIEEVDHKHKSRPRSILNFITDWLLYLIGIVFFFKIIIPEMKQLGTEKSQIVQHVNIYTQEFNFTGKLVPLHFVTHLVDDPLRHSLASFVTGVTGKAEADHTSEDYKATFCDQMHVGLEFLKEVDALQEANKDTYSERKFFEMECQFLDFGLSEETGKPELAMHFFYNFN